MYVCCLVLRMCRNVCEKQNKGDVRFKLKVNSGKRAQVCLERPGGLGAWRGRNWEVRAVWPEVKCLGPDWGQIAC